MNKTLHERLKAKGWSATDIKKAVKIINGAQKKKPKQIQILDSVIYWFVLIIAIIGNMVISVALVPFLLEFRHFFLYVIITTMALIFGFLFDFLIRDIESLEQKHVVVAGLLIPALALINIYYTTNFANYVSATLKLGYIHSPYLISVVYVLAFISPYLVYRIVYKKPFY
ncbi:MAG: hypothetical protein ABIC04_02865 [Nanoarchaeota archaeon]